MTPTVVVDASVWVSLLVGPDVHHSASRTWLQNHLTRHGRVVTPALALCEVAGAISRRTGAPSLGRRAVEQLLRLRELRVVTLDRHLATASAHLAADLGLRGADAVYVAAAHHLRIPLVTWDREQHERAQALITVSAPA